MNDPVDVHKRIVDAYFETTSHAGVGDNPQAFRESIRSIDHRLGSWGPKKGQHILDLGAGTGQLCGLAVERGAVRVVGVNLSRGENEFAASRVMAEFVCQDVCDYLTSTATPAFDRIYALNILEHLDKDSLVKVLEGARACLKPGGQLIAMVPNATSPFGTMTRYWDITHQLSFTPSSVRQLSVLTDFPSVEFRECGPVPHGPVSLVRYLLWQLIRLCIWSYFMVELASGKGHIYTADMLFRLTKGDGELF